MGSAVSLVEQAQQWRLVGLHLERLSDIVAHPREEIRLLPRPQNMEAPSIRIDGLSFAYSPTEPAILDNLSARDSERRLRRDRRRRPASARPP